jgi:hypothetical protein
MSCRHLGSKCFSKHCFEEIFMPADTITPAAAESPHPVAKPRPSLTCTCCAGPESRWFTPGSCALHPAIPDDQVDSLIDNPEADPPLSIYAAAAARWDLPVWAMFVPGTTRDMFENDAAKIRRLVQLVTDYLDCPDTQRSHIECMAAGLAKINRREPALPMPLCEELAHE